MDVDDISQTEVAAAIAALALLASPRARGLLRRGAVVTLAGALKLGASLTSATHSVAGWLHQAQSTTGDDLEDLVVGPGSGSHAAPAE